MPRPSAQTKLMAAAINSFQTNGFKASTIEDIASKAGVVKGSFYNHFKSKEVLAVEAVKLFITEALKTLSLEGPPSAMKRLRGHFETFATIQHKGHFREGCLLANFSGEITDAHPALRSALDDGVERWCRELTEVIRQAQAEGDIEKQYKADHLARFLVNAWEGATIRTKVVRSQQPLDEFLSIIFKGFLASKKP
jgi:TetR/AcrR family transcriptional repressor of nem operon